MGCPIQPNLPSQLFRNPYKIRHRKHFISIMLFINVHSMRRMSELNDTAIPDELWERCLEADGDPKSVRLLGTEVCTTLSAELLEAGAPGLHLYTMNRSVAALDLIDRLDLGR